MVCLVTGGTGGIGLAAAFALSDAGHIVYTLSRREAPEGASLPHIAADVTDASAMRAAAETLLSREGRIDLLVHCAGFGISGAVEFTASEDAARQLEVNLIGLQNAVSAVLPVMRRQQSGRIVAVSSVAGVLPIPFQTWYSVSKAGVNSFVRALGMEVRPFGISVCAVMPGDTRTGFTAARKRSSKGDDVYGGRITRSVSKMEHDEQTGVSPETVGCYIASIAQRRQIRSLYTVGFAYKAAYAAAKLLPVPLQDRLLYILYAR